jgi:hypothetical protein
MPRMPRSVQVFFELLAQFAYFKIADHFEAY